MSKMLRKVLMLSVATMLLFMVFMPTINKATELDLNSIIEDEEEEEPIVIQEPENTVTEDETNTTTENLVTDKDYKGNTTTPTENTTNTTNTSSEEEIPKTGLTEDITIMAIIGLCVISAVFAYKKVAEYKI